VAARGKTAYETSIILGISEDTVIQHLKMARERSALHSRHELTTFALLWASSASRTFSHGGGVPDDDRANAKHRPGFPIPWYGGCPAT
jgi:hypothetical protein